ncbi:MAG: hypothetical protein JXR03_20775 [Cyclobacteriaceae bacterium]
MSRFFILVLALLGLVFSGIAQIKTSVTFSNPWIDRAKQIDKERKAYEKHLEDSVEYCLPSKELLQLDSLNKGIIQQSIASSYQKYSRYPELNQLLELRQLGETYKQNKDSLTSINKKEYAQQYVENKKKFLNNVFRKYNEPDFAYHAMFLYAPHYSSQQLDSSQLKDLSSTQVDSLMQTHASQDSLFEAKIIPRLEKYSSNSSLMGVELNSLGSLSQLERMRDEQERVETYQSNFNRYRTKKNLKANFEELGPTTVIQNNARITEAHESLSTYKKKYTTLPSSQNLKTGVKISSLEGENLVNRIKWGGTLRINQRNTIEVDFAPSVAFMFNKKWSLGTEAIVRGEFMRGRSWLKAFHADTYGGRLFSDYQFYKSFFAHAEYERLYSSQKSLLLDNAERSIVPGAMAGLGKLFKLGKGIKGKAIVQYNFLYDNTNSVYSSPWVFRFGFEIRTHTKTKNK